MSNKEKNMRSKIQKLEDAMLRCKNIQKQIEMRLVLQKYRVELQKINQNEQKSFY